MTQDIDQLKEQLLNQIKENRKRIPPDLLSRAQSLAEEQLRQQQEGERETQKGDYWQKDIDFSRFPRAKVEKDVSYDKQAAQNVVEHFFKNFDTDNNLLKKIRDMLS